VGGGGGGGVRGVEEEKARQSHAEIPRTARIPEAPREEKNILLPLSFLFFPFLFLSSFIENRQRVSARERERERERERGREPL